MWTEFAFVFVIAAFWRCLMSYGVMGHGSWDMRNGLWFTHYGFMAH